MTGRPDAATTPPPITRRTPGEIDAIRCAGALAASILGQLAAAGQPGVTTGALDQIAHDAMKDAGAEPLFLGYSQRGARPFPASTCISINDEIVHGIPGPRRLQVGDVVSIDVGLRFDGWCADNALTLLVSDGRTAINPRRVELVRATRRVLDLAIQLIRPGTMWLEIAGALERETAESGFGLVTEYVGHGIGRTLHEPPKAPAYATGFSGYDFCLEPGMVIAVEPMLTEGLGDGPIGEAGADGLPAWRMPVRLLEDAWTVATRDGSAACHEEHTIAVTDDGCEILTPRTVEIPDDLR